MCAPGCQMPGVETHVAPRKLTLRIDYVGQSGTTWVKLSLIGAGCKSQWYRYQSPHKAVTHAPPDPCVQYKILRPESRISRLRNA
jgi:hypothetical protein